MPLNCIPATTSVRALEEKAAALEEKCATDVGLWGAAQFPAAQAKTGAMLDAGALGSTCFLVDSGVPEFGWLREAISSLAMNALATRNAPLLVHAEAPRTHRARETERGGERRGRTSRICDRARRPRRPKPSSFSFASAGVRGSTRTSFTCPQPTRSKRSRARKTIRFFDGRDHAALFEARSRSDSRRRNRVQMRF